MLVNGEVEPKFDCSFKKVETETRNYFFFFFLIRERRPYFLNLDAAVCLRFALGKIREMKIEETLNIVRKK